MKCFSRVTCHLWIAITTSLRDFAVVMCSYVHPGPLQIFDFSDDSEDGACQCQLVNVELTT